MQCEPAACHEQHQSDQAADDAKRVQGFARPGPERGIVRRERVVGLQVGVHHRIERDVRQGSDKAAGKRDAPARACMQVEPSALALNTNQVSPEDLKWVVLLVLLNQPGRESCLARMEDLVYSEEPAYLH